MRLRVEDIAFVLEHVALPRDLVERLRRTPVELEMSDDQVAALNDACMAYVQEQEFTAEGFGHGGCSADRPNRGCPQRGLTGLRLTLSPLVRLDDLETFNALEMADVARNQRYAGLDADRGLHRVAHADLAAGCTEIVEERTRAQAGAAAERQAGH
jgi:hypothetical protein